MNVVKMWLVALIFPPVLASAQAADTEMADHAVSFIAGYIKADEQNHSGYQWVIKNPDLTKEFRRAYVKYLDRFKVEGSLGSDPILNAQDTPDASSSFKATAISVTGDRATVELTVDEWPGYAIRMQFVRTEGKWLINAINKINWQR